MFDRLVAELSPQKKFLMEQVKNLRLYSFCKSHSYFTHIYTSLLMKKFTIQENFGLLPLNIHAVLIENGFIYTKLDELV